MSSVNKVILVGHLGADPEVRRTQSGAPVVNFNLATSEKWRDKTTGERKEHTDWHRVVIWTEGLCKVAEQYLKKGSKVYIEGKLQTRKWTDQAGVDRYTTEVVLSGFNATVVMLDRAQGGVPPAQSEADYGTGDTRDFGARSDPAASGAAGKPSYDDEIPF